jgi:hypothetical protein
MGCRREALGIEARSDNLGAGSFAAVAYNANLGWSNRRDNIVAKLYADDIRRPQL